MSNKILVTGATGKVAQGAIQQLRAQKHDVRVLVRNETKGQDLKTLGCEIAVGEFTDKASLAKAVDGCSTIFLVTPAGPDASMWASNVIEAAKASASKPRIVRLSAVGASKTGPTANSREHGKTDREIMDSGLAYTIMRPSFFMQNMFMSGASMAAEGKFYMGMGEGKLGIIDTRDISDVAAKLCVDTSWDYGVYELTGPASISFGDMARTFSAELGKEITYVAVPPEAVEKSIKDAGMGDWFAGVMKDYSKAYAANWNNFTTSFVEKITGHAPRSFQTFVKEVFAPATKR